MNTRTTSTFDRTHRILVVANETATAHELHDLVSSRIDRRPGSYNAVLVVAPAVDTEMIRLLGDDDPARRPAELRLCECVESLRRRGIESAGVVGDIDPMRAIEDTLRVFPADELVIAA